MITGEFYIGGVWVKLTKHTSEAGQHLDAHIGDKVVRLPQTDPLDPLPMGEETARLALSLANGLILG
jgi:hypothetical protein